MTGLSFGSWLDGQYVSLEAILRLLIDDLPDVTWRVRVDEAGEEPGGSALESQSSDEMIDSARLLELVHPDVQVVDGEVSAYNPRGTQVLTVRAVDSTWWDIEAAEPALLNKVLLQFPDAMTTTD